MQTQPPLVVDLDGTLVRTDLLHETLVGALQRSPWIVFLLPFWLARGRAALKRELATRASISPAALPYRDEVVALLRRERAAVRRLVLATAADETVARAVAAHVGLFDDVVASDGKTNVKGSRKRAALVERYGERGFDYAGNERADLPVWASARRAIVVSADAGLAAQAGQAATEMEHVALPGSGWGAAVRALRLYQWPKNLVVFVPLVMAHRVGDPHAIASAAIAYFAFCLVASAVYLVNDLMDLEADRTHATKRARPLASGDLGIALAVTMVPVLLVTGAGLAAMAGRQVLAAVACYALLGFLYSAALKRLAVVDIFVIAALFAIRIQGGAFAVGVPVSDWLFAFSLFFFLSIALAKRHAELKRFAAGPAEPVRLPGRGYEAADVTGVGILGTIAGYLSVVVLAFYITSREVTVLYRHPGLLWIAAVLMLFWITRLWLLAHRGTLGEDPLSFALRDPTSYAVGAATLLALAAAT